VRSALDGVTAIQALLADVYKEVCGGRTLQRELVQNADDALTTDGPQQPRAGLSTESEKEF
jgi:hypothetical protein